MENERNFDQEKEQKINDLIEKEKELRVITLEKEKEEKRREIHEKEMKKSAEYAVRKKNFEEFFENLQKLKHDIFLLKSYTGHSERDSVITQSLGNFRFLLF